MRARSSGWMRSIASSKVRRAGRRVDAPEAEHVPVPAAFAGRDARAPRRRCGRTPAPCRAARPGGAPARRGTRVELTSAKVQSDARPRDARRGRRPRAARRRRLRRRSSPLSSAPAASSRANEQPRVESPAAASAATVEQAASPRRPAQPVAARSGRWPRRSCRSPSVQREQVAALLDERLQQRRPARGRPGSRGRSWAAATVYRPGGPPSSAASTQASATWSTSLPKFSPRNSLSSVSGKVSRPTTTSSRLFMRPSFR